MEGIKPPQDPDAMMYMNMGHWMAGLEGSPCAEKGCTGEVKLHNQPTHRGCQVTLYGDCNRSSKHHHVFHNGVIKRIKLTGTGPGKGHLKANIRTVVGAIFVNESYDGYARQVVTMT